MMNEQRGGFRLAVLIRPTRVQQLTTWIERILKWDDFTGGLMKVRFVVTLLGSTLGFALSAFGDEAPTAAASTQDAISVDSDSPIGVRQSRITTRSDPRNSIQSHPTKRSERARQVRRARQTEKGILHSTTRMPPTRLTAPPSRGLLYNTGITTRPSLGRAATRSGSGVANFQIETGIQIQFPTS
jgi:hypothetical protein